MNRPFKGNIHSGFLKEIIENMFLCPSTFCFAIQNKAYNFPCLPFCLARNAPWGDAARWPLDSSAHNELRKRHTPKAFCKRGDNLHIKILLCSAGRGRSARSPIDSDGSGQAGGTTAGQVSRSRAAHAGRGGGRSALPRRFQRGTLKLSANKEAASSSSPPSPSPLEEYRGSRR